MKNETVLVLGGGGVAGIAWLTGLLYGLEEAGMSLRTRVDSLIGTSAGSTVAAQIAGETDLIDLFKRQVDPAWQVTELAPEPHLLELMVNAMPVLFNIGDPPERTRSIGKLATRATTVAETTRRDVIAARLPGHDWPDRDLRIIAVDVMTGEPMIFNRHSGVDLVDAVAASCAVPGIWPPVTIGGHRYMDGGIRSSDNADLATGYARVLILSPLGTAGIALPGNGLADQIEILEAGGARVRLLDPDDAARRAMGRNPLSPETRTPAAEAGRSQGRELAADVAAFIESAVSF